MDTTKLKAFLLIEKLGSFSKAAEAFSYTPSAFSHMADSLEEELGVKLFHRTYKGVEITEEGQRLKQHFHDILNAEKGLFEAAAILSGSKQHTLRIGAYPSIALHILPDILNGFKKKYPMVQTSILIDDKLSTWIREDISDVIFTDRPPEGEAGWFPMLRDDYAAVVSGEIFSGKNSVTIEELYEFPFIRTNETKLNEYFEYERFREIINLKSVEDATAVSLVKGGIGIAVLPRLSVKEVPEGVRILSLDPSRSRTLGFAVKSGRLPEATEWFVQYVLELAHL